jgi:SAM-dependent methyltransferase
VTHIDYGLSDNVWEDVIPDILGLIETHGFTRVVEIGAGANPTLPADFVASRGIVYTLLDISQAELDKAPVGYLKVCVDICADEPFPEGQYDFAFSRMLAEHVPDGTRFHRDIRSLLREDGYAVHLFPTLFALPFLINAMLPEALAEKLLHLLQPGRERSGLQGKFPAHYSWCRGPLQSQIRRFERLGYEVEQYLGFYGHGGYYRKIPILKRTHEWLSRILCRHPVPALTSFAEVVLVKRAIASK